jgi:hypothetical protein
VRVTCDGVGRMAAACRCGFSPRVAYPLVMAESASARRAPRAAPGARGGGAPLLARAPLSGSYRCGSRTHARSCSVRLAGGVRCAQLALGGVAARVTGLQPASVARLAALPTAASGALSLPAAPLRRFAAERAPPTARRWGSAARGGARRCTLRAMAADTCAQAALEALQRCQLAGCVRALWVVHADARARRLARFTSWLRLRRGAHSRLSFAAGAAPTGGHLRRSSAPCWAPTRTRCAHAARRRRSRCSRARAPPIADAAACACPNCRCA